AHGTGTPLGDPIEVHGLQTAFRRLAQEASADAASASRCGLGSVKPNIGHLEGAAGVAGVVKVLLCMQEQVLPATLNFGKLNTLIELEGTGFYVVDRPQEWNPKLNGRALRRRAGVSSFGFGGVNSHVVLEEYCSRETESDGGGAAPESYCIVLSAKTPTA